MQHLQQSTFMQGPVYNSNPYTSQVITQPFRSSIAPIQVSNISYVRPPIVNQSPYVSQYPVQTQAPVQTRAPVQTQAPAISQVVQPARNSQGVFVDANHSIIFQPVYYPFIQKQEPAPPQYKQGQHHNYNYTEDI